MLVCARRASGQAVALPRAPSGITDGRLLVGTEPGVPDLVLEGHTVTIPASDGPHVSLYRV